MGAIVGDADFDSDCAGGRAPAHARHDDTRVDGSPRYATCASASRRCGTDRALRVIVERVAGGPYCATALKVFR
jgi:hypothetical protein